MRPIALALAVLLSLDGCSSDSTPEPTTGKACTPGTTQACTGPGACVGGQACLSDGSGYGACACGTGGSAGSGGGAGAGGAGQQMGGGAGEGLCIQVSHNCDPGNDICCAPYKCIDPVGAPPNTHVCGGS